MTAITTDLLCPVCGHSINHHQFQGCYKLKPSEDKTPGNYCPCQQSAADIALYDTKQLRARIAELKVKLKEALEDEREL